MQTIRITIVKNGDFGNQKIIVVRKDWDQIMTSAKNKLRMKNPFRIFARGGRELGQQDMNFLENDAYLVISDHREFLGTKKSEEIDLTLKIVGDQDFIKKHEIITRIIATKSYIEDEAVKQLDNVSKTLLNVRYAIGMPDMHPGRGFPIGTAIATAGIIYPHLIGTDIGCGMSLYKTNCQVAKAKVEKWIKSLYIDDEWEGDLEKFISDREILKTGYDKSLGTIGGGNHFAELQEIVEIRDVEAGKALGLDMDMLYLLVHSGSRSLGESILRSHEDSFGTKGLIESSKEASEYMALHDNACQWARSNRELIGMRFLDCLGMEGTPILDIWHNNVEKKVFENGEQLYLHRKGAAPLDKGPIVIPGSRGAFSYLVTMDDETKSEYSGYSVAHGAGRKWKRSKALNMGKLDKQTTVENLTTTSFGSKVICEDKELLFEEMPDAYKDIDCIIHDLVSEKIVKVIAVFKPVITYKTRK